MKSSSALIFGALLLSSPLAHSKVVQHLALQVTAENPAKPADYSQRGWSCSDSQNISLFETVANYDGAWAEKPVSIRKDGNVNRVARDMNRFNHRFEISGNETCSRDYRVLRTVTETEYDTKGNPRQVTRTKYVTETETASIDWKCRPLAQFPTEPGTTRGLNDFCAMSYKMNGHNADDGARSKAAFKPYFEGKKIRVQLWAEKYDEQYAYSNCSGHPAHMRIITITQGVGGHVGENDFKFNVMINGEKAEIPSADGLINADLAYCDPSGRASPVTVGISAVEEDLLFNDEYVPSGVAHLDPSTPQTANKTLTLTRQKFLYGYIGVIDSIRDWWAPTQAQVKLWMHARMLSDQANNFGLGYSATEDKSGGGW